MTTAKTVGAVSSEAAEWYAIDWQAIHRNVRRLQVRIAQATKEGRWGKVRALQHLLTHSYVNVRGTTRLTSAAIGEVLKVLNRLCDVVIWLMSANSIFQQSVQISTIRS